MFNVYRIYVGLIHLMTVSFFYEEKKIDYHLIFMKNRIAQFRYILRRIVAVMIEIRRPRIDQQVITLSPGRQLCHFSVEKFPSLKFSKS